MIGLALLLPLIARQNDDFTKTWETVSTAISKNFYAREARKAEMDRLLAEYAPRAKAAVSREDFETVVNEMIQAFHDSHFELLTRSDQGYYLMQGISFIKTADQMPEIGAWFAHSETGFEVRMVLDGGEAERVGLRKGDIVKTIDGVPFTPIDSLKTRVGSEATLSVMRGASNLSFQVKVDQKSCLDMFLDASRASAKIIQDHGRQIGYFHLWTQLNDSFRNTLSGAVYGKLKDTDAFILDLRDGFGGRPEGFGDPFFRPDYWIKWASSPTSSYTQLFGYGRPLVVLINGGSRSAKEILSYTFKVSKRGYLIGRTTAGNVLGTFPQKVNDWAFLEIPIVDVIVQGTRLESKGVAPDTTIPQESDENGRDLDLAAALDRLKNVSPYRGDVFKDQPKSATK